MILPKYDPAYDPVEHLDRMGVRIVRHSLNNSNAIWVPERKFVILDRKLRSDLVRPTLGHECVHVEFNDAGGHHPKNESRANLHSGLRLTSPSLWESLTAIHSDYDYICLELGITRRQFLAVYDYRKQQAALSSKLERLGATTYLEPRMGAGQFLAKVGP